MNLIRFINKIRDRRKFTLERYEEFLKVISQYKVLPLNEFRNYHNPDEVVIGLRHDSDSSFTALNNMMWTERGLGIRSTYFILHTAKYFYPYILPTLTKIQAKGFEIGLHQDAMKSMFPQDEVLSVLRDLRNCGINIIGTSAHGDKAHKNIHFWDNYNKSDFGIEYEAYELDYNLYFSDCTFINGHRWHPLDLPELKAGDRVQILIHPEHHTS